MIFKKKNCSRFKVIVANTRRAQGAAHINARRQAPQPAQLEQLNELGEALAGKLAFSVVILGASGAEASTGTLRDLRGQHFAHLIEQLTPLNAGVDTFSPPAQENGWYVFIHPGDRLEAHFLTRLAETILFAERPIECCYFDEDHVSPQGFADPVLKPDFNLDLLRSFPYTGRNFAISAQALDAIGGLDLSLGDSCVSDALFKMVETRGPAAIGHLVGIDYHAVLSYADWLQREETQSGSRLALTRHLDRLATPHDVREGDLAIINRIDYLVGDQHPLVSIIIPTRDRLALLSRCVESLIATIHAERYEILIVDQASSDPQTRTWLAGINEASSGRVQVVDYPHSFNFAAMLAQGAARARGEYLLALHDDTEPLHIGWLGEMLNHARRAEVGVVGAKLLGPEGRIDSAGVIMGLGEAAAGSAFQGEEEHAPGYMHRLLTVQNYSAVSSACMMIDRRVYDALGGLDAQAFTDGQAATDFCLRAREQGYLTVWTPYARVRHLSGGKRPEPVAADQEPSAALPASMEILYQRWMPRIARDPAFNPLFSLRGNSFQLEGWDHRRCLPERYKTIPRIATINADSFGCGHYRVLKPAKAMAEAQLIEAVTLPEYLSPAEFARLAPDALVLQRQTTAQQRANIVRLKRLHQLFTVFELDDYLPGLPLKSIHYRDIPKAVIRELRAVLKEVDRLVVSTPPLAEALGQLHRDIRVVKNRLPLEWWQHLHGARRVGKKPRVGWAGGSGHTGDLEVIRGVIDSIGEEVEWVFMGMHPEGLGVPFEYHPGVVIDEYPAALASLNLDLALAPLELNLFNRCKSSLRLLEFGACGFPVICTDIEPYRDGFPVTRVKNRHKDWVDAIRMHLSDLDANARKGDELRRFVLDQHMLQGTALTQWRKAWLPD